MEKSPGVPSVFSVLPLLLSVCLSCLFSSSAAPIPLCSMLMRRIRDVFIYRKIERDIYKIMFYTTLHAFTR